MNTVKIKWTVSIIAQYDLEVKEEYVELESSILSQSPSNYIRYVIFFYDQKSETACIKQSEISPSGTIVLHTVDNLGKIDFYDLIHLKKFFRNYSANPDWTAGSDHKHFLLTWGHGTGFGFFAKKLKDATKAFSEDFLGGEEFTEETKNLVEYLTFLKGNVSIEFTKDFYNNLWNAFATTKNLRSTNAEEGIKMLKKLLSGIRAEDMANVICAGLNRWSECKETDDKIKANIMLCTNCYMQTLETGYALKDAVDILIASQTTIPFFGYNYRKLFGLLHANPAVPETEIAENITNYYLIKYIEEPIKSEIKKLPRYNKLDVKNDVVITANNLKFYPEIVKNLKKLTCHFMYNKNKKVYLDKLTLKEVIEFAVMECGWVTGGNDSGVIDFLHFYEKICYRHDYIYVKKLLKPLGQTLLSITKKTRLSIYNNSDRMYNTDFDRRDNPNLSPTFFSIFLPVCLNSTVKKLILYEIYKEGTQKCIGFYADSEWDDFIYHLLGIWHEVKVRRDILTATQREVVLSNARPKSAH